MDDQRRAYLLAKFPAINNPRPLNPRVSTQVRAIDRAERIVEQVWSWAWEGQDPQDPAAVLFDPARAPALAKRADMAAAEFHRLAAKDARARAEGEQPLLRYDTGDGLDADYNPNDPAEQGVVRIWRVGRNQVYIVRERWRDAPDREWSTTDYFAHLFEFLLEQLDYHDCTKFGCDGDCDLKCSVRLAKACDGVTRLLPVNRGTLVLLFRCCTACEVLAGQIAANTHKTNWKLAEIEARERLPPDPTP
jgi:hypothetical protein